MVEEDLLARLLGEILAYALIIGVPAFFIGWKLARRKAKPKITT